MVKIEMYDFIKRMLFEWDSDYTKVTEQEREKIAHAESSSFIDEDEIDWDNIEEYLLDWNAAGDDWGYGDMMRII